MRRPTSCPDSKPADELLREMQARRCTSPSSSTSTAARRPGHHRGHPRGDRRRDHRRVRRGRDRGRGARGRSARVSSRYPVDDLDELFGLRGGRGGRRQRRRSDGQAPRQGPDPRLGRRVRTACASRPRADRRRNKIGTVLIRATGKSPPAGDGAPNTRPPMAWTSTPTSRPLSPRTPSRCHPGLCHPSPDVRGRGRAVRDNDGRTYAAATVDLPPSASRDPGLRRDGGRLGLLRWASRRAARRGRGGHRPGRGGDPRLRRRRWSPSTLGDPERHAPRRRTSLKTNLAPASRFEPDNTGGWINTAQPSSDCARRTPPSRRTPVRLAKTTSNLFRPRQRPARPASTSAGSTA